MRKVTLSTLFAWLLLMAAAPQVWAQEEEPPDDVEVPEQEDQDFNKRGQTLMKFLKMPISARAAGMSNAMTAMEANSFSMFYNPAGMARLGSQNMATIGLSTTQLTMDINYNAAALAYAPNGGAYGTFGLMLMMVDYGEFEGTIRADNDAGYIDTGTFSPQAWTLGLAYARALTDRFAVGGVVKVAQLDLASSVMGFEDGGDALSPGSYLTQDNVERAFPVVDFGVLYQTGFRSLNFAMSARNFSREVTYEEDNYELPLTFSIGVSMDLMDLASLNTDQHSLQFAVDAERPRDFSEHFKVGGEYTFMNVFSLRAGYSFPADAEGVSLGLGLNYGFDSYRFGADYAYTDYGVLGNINRIALQVGI